MEEKERYEYFFGTNTIKDNKTNQFYGCVVDLLNQQDKRIKELEEELDDAKRDYIPKLEFGLQRVNKMGRDAEKEKRIVELKQQLAITEKALEFACEEITGSCEYCSYKTRIECPVEADCLDEKINYFKSQAKEIINGYKQDD